MLKSLLYVLSRVIFASRWLQAPLYLGLVITLGIYGYRFLLSLAHLLYTMPSATDNQIMLEVLDLVDVVMIANLLIMIIMGGYETFVSRLHLNNEVDCPEWLDELNTGVMKVKLALALVGISSIHLLRTFIDPTAVGFESVKYQVIIHLTLLISALAVAYTNRLIDKQS